MKKIIKYKSILGREFDSEAEALADEDRLPSIIATYEHDVLKMKTEKTFAGKPVNEDTIRLFSAAVVNYKKMLEEVTEQRKIKEKT